MQADAEKHRVAYLLCFASHTHPCQTAIGLKVETTMSDSQVLKIAVIYGSVRTARQGIKAARFMVNKVEQRGHEATLIDALDYELPLLDKMYREFEEGTAPKAMTSVSELLNAADGFLVISAEYNHSIPAALKNLLDHYQSEYFYKPSGIVTYSAGPFGGVRGLANLRTILAELGTPSIPSAFPISEVYAAVDNDGNALDEAYEKRVIKFLDEFEWYTKALKCARTAEACSKAVPVQQQMCRGKS